MHSSLSAVTLRHFRSYNEAAFEFDPGVNIIIGPNAVGKTNLLEAVYLSCFGKGFRSKSDSELLKTGAEWARIDSVFGRSSRVVKLEKLEGASRLKKHFEIGGSSRSRLRFEDLVPVVLFQPDDLRLTAGGPERRRLYIDSILTQLIPSYRQDMLAYERVLKQRNSLLKADGPPSPDMIFVWNLQLAERGGRIATHRQELIGRFNSRISNIYSLVAGTTHSLSIFYKSSLPTTNYSDALLKGLETGLSIDTLRGFTGAGPHRDDFGITIDGHIAKEVASRGENRTLLLALKIMELEEIEQVQRTKPLLLLDDVFSELDGSRRKLLTKFLADYQSLITTPDVDVVGKKFTQSANILSL